MDLGPLEISLFELTETRQTKQMIIHELVITEKETGTRRNVRHLHYTEWPDHGIPQSTDLFLNLAKITDESNLGQKPIVVHCRFAPPKIYSNNFLFKYITIKVLDWDEQEHLLWSTVS